MDTSFSNSSETPQMAEPTVMLQGSSPIQSMGLLALQEMPSVIIQNKTRSAKHQSNIIKGITTSQENLLEQDHSTPSNQQTFATAKENVSCCCKYLLPSTCRAMETLVFPTENEQSSDSNENSFLTIKKKFVIPCLSIVRPKLSVDLTEGGILTKLGELQIPLSCFRYELTVVDSSRNMLFSIKSKNFPMLLSCCKQYHEETFSIYDTNEKLVGSLTKWFAPCKCMCSREKKEEHYKLCYPRNCTKEEKMLLLTAAFALNFLYFSSSSELEAQRCSD